MSSPTPRRYRWEIVYHTGPAELGPYQLVHVKFGISSWRSSGVDGRSYLLSGAIDGSKANRIIHDSKLEFENSRFTFHLVPLSYKSVDVVWRDWDDIAKTVFRMRNGHVEVYGYAFWVNQCTSGFHGVNEPVFQQRGSRAKRKLSRCGRNQMGNEPILALPEGADDFVVYYDAQSKDLEACLEKGEGDCLYTATTEGSYEELHG
ncbi:hypothetical protein Tco_0667955 [Tanacetum coccineum]